jgi:hypothetical protein
MTERDGRRNSPAPGGQRWKLLNRRPESSVEKIRNRPTPASAGDRSKLEEEAPGTKSDLLGPPAANRHRLLNERSAITHHFAFGGHEGYLTVGFYPNGQPGEIFIRMAKAGSTIAGLMECFGTVVSVSLQHGVPSESALRQAIAYTF